MFNSTAIEVVIGLVFIYILYSLLVTIITELFSSLTNQRGKILKKGIKRMLDDDDGKPLFSDKFIDSPEIKYMSNKFMNKNRLPSYISPAKFSKTFVNVMKKLGKTEDVLVDYKKALEDDKDKSDTKEMIYNMMNEAGQNLNDFKNQLEIWYDETMDRVAGWYKRRIQIITFCIALIVVFVMNVDTIAIAKKLSSESNTRIELVKIATDYAKATETVADTTVQADENIKEEVRQIINDIKEQQSVISTGFPGFHLKTKEFWLYILGCLITAIALSLGAPFWFDLLNKLVKMRSAGTQEKTEKMTLEDQKKKKKSFIGKDES